MKNYTKLAIVYLIWAALLQQHAGAGQKLFATFNGTPDRLLGLTGYLGTSLLVIIAGAFLCRPYHTNMPFLVAKAFLAWVVAFTVFWLAAPRFFANVSIENPFGLFGYFVLPHLVLPVAPLAVVAFAMVRGQVAGYEETPNQAL